MPTRASKSLAFLADLNAKIIEFRPIDFHLHQGSWAKHLDLEQRRDPVVQREDLLDTFGVEEYALQAGLSHDHSYSAALEANRVAIEEHRQSKRSLACPAIVGLKDGRAIEVLEIAKQEGHYGITFHHRYMGTIIDDAKMWPVLEWAGANDWPLFVHALSESQVEAVWRVERLAREFPHLTFFVMDALASSSGIAQSLEIAKRYDNIFFDTTLMTPIPLCVEMWVKGAGSEKLIFGSDLMVGPPTYRFPSALFEIAASNVSDDDMSRILRGNALRLLRPHLDVTGGPTN